MNMNYRVALSLFLSIQLSYAFAQFHIQTYLPHHNGVSIAIDSQQTLWTNDTEGNITSFDGRLFTTFPSLLKDFDGQLYTTDDKVFISSDGVVYSMSANDTLVREENANLDPFFTEKNVNLPAEGFDAIINTKTQIEKNNYILTDFTGELYILKKGKYRKYVIQGLPLLPDVNAIKKDQDRLIIATQNQGVFIWDEAQYLLHGIDMTDGLLSNNITDIAIDKDRNVWLGSDKGIHVIVWKMQEAIKPPNVTINMAKYGEEALKNKTRFTNISKGLKFEFSGRDLLFANDVEYQWTLNAEKNGWSSYSKEQKVYYDNLPPGNYTFQVRASTDRRYYSFSNKIEFTIERSLWKSYWPYIFSVLGGVFLVSCTSYFYHNNTIRKITNERDKIVQENKLLKSQRKTLQLQMNPHFVFNALSAVQGLIALKENKKARKHLQSFSSLMRRMLDQSRDEEISVQNEITFLEQYLSIEKMARNDRFDYEIEVDNTVNMDHTIPPMLIQPIVENAIVHGMKGLNRKGSITVHLSMSGSSILCTVTDDGVGRIVKKEKNHISHAMRILQERILYHQPEEQEVVKIIDKVDENGSATGTTVTLIIPIL